MSSSVAQSTTGDTAESGERPAAHNVAFPQQLSSEHQRTIAHCRRILEHVIQAGIVGSWAEKLRIYVLDDEADLLPDYDGVTHFDGENSCADRIGLRVRGPNGEPYKAAAVVGTFLHELAHAVDGYRHTGKQAHAPPFYRHYARVVTAASKADLFQLPKGCRGSANRKTLQRFDDLSPFSDLLDTCLPCLGHDNQPAPVRKPGGPVFVTLRHWKYGSVEKVVALNNQADTAASLHSRLSGVFKQKFPKFSSKVRNEFYIDAFPERHAAILVTEAHENDEEISLQGGETITCRPAG